MSILEDSRNELEASLTRIANGYMANLRMLKIYYSPEFSGRQKVRKFLKNHGFYKEILALFDDPNR